MADVVARGKNLKKNLKSNSKSILELLTTGIWVRWDGCKKGVPNYAVVGGEDDGVKLYFARYEEHNNREVYMGDYIKAYNTNDVPKCRTTYNFYHELNNYEVN